MSQNHSAPFPIPLYKIIMPLQCQLTTDSLPCPACECDRYTDGFGNAYKKILFFVALQAINQFFEPTFLSQTF